MSRDVRIFKPCKTAMQSGKMKTNRWQLAFKPEATQKDPLMGWSAGQDMKQQLLLSFPTCEDAIAYAKRKGWTFTVETPQRAILQPKRYADNFTLGRLR